MTMPQIKRMIILKKENYEPLQLNVELMFKLKIVYLIGLIIF